MTFDLTAFISVIAVALLVIGAYLRFGRRQPVQAVMTYSLSQAIADIKAELRKLEDGEGSWPDLTLGEIKIELLVQEDTSQSANASVGVPVFPVASVTSSAGWDTTKSSKVGVTLVPPKPTKGFAPEDAVFEAKIEFASLLKAIRRQLVDAMGTPPRLDTKSVELVLNFLLVVENKQTGKIEVKLANEKSGPSAGVDLSSKNTSSNTVTLKYVNPDYVAEKDAAKD